MKILIAAPNLVSPWTEGRKNFIRDLIKEIKPLYDISILSTFTGKKTPKDPIIPNTNYIRCHSRTIQLLKLNINLITQISKRKRPEIIIHFPFGTFNGIRGIANYLSTFAIHATAKMFNIPCLTVLYSMTGGNLLKLNKKFRFIATSLNDNWPGYIINVGIDCSKEKNNTIKESNARKLLFLAGYYEDKDSLLDNILYERGLIDIITIGEKLSAAGFTLSIGIPLLKHTKQKKRLEEILKRKAPSLKVTLYTQVNVNNLFKNHGMYIFPYRKNYNIFIPTSILEAMYAKIPVIASDLQMLKPLIGDINESYFNSYSATNPHKLFETIIESTSNWNATEKMAQRASKNICQNWNIKNSGEQLKSIISDILSRQ